MMNYLAHAVLAQPTPESLVGNLLGDFCKGVDLNVLSKPVLAGLANHRATDRFTDQHPLVIQAKQQFSSKRRRFAGVALDVLFDHFLIVHWQKFHSGPFLIAKQQLYRQLAAAEHLMPSGMCQIMQKVREQDWLSAYENVAGVAYALDRIASRIRFTHAFTGVIADISPHYEQFEQMFLQFYPQLQAHIRELALE